MNMLKKIFAVLPVFAVLLITQAYARYVIPSGECVGIKIYTDGVVVIDTAEVTDINGKKFDIASGYDINKGDIITCINGKKISSIDDVSDELTSSEGNVTLTVKTNDQLRDITITPPETADGKKLGLWLRDSTAGLGTITYIDDNTFAALGHGICDIDTGNIMPINQGIIQGCTITSIAEGRSGSPGALIGDINGAKLGTIIENTDTGLFGKLTTSLPDSREPVEVMTMSDVRTGSASILADIDGKGVREYSIEIQKIYPTALSSKDMVIKVTDRDLIQKTGGIIQGMSGAPILQNGCLVGAVTHVFVNDPTCGYAIFAEHMMKNQ